MISICWFLSITIFDSKFYSPSHWPFPLHWLSLLTSSCPLSKYPFNLSGSWKLLCLPGHSSHGIGSIHSWFTEICYMILYYDSERIYAKALTLFPLLESFVCWSSCLTALSLRLSYLHLTLFLKYVFPACAISHLTVTLRSSVVILMAFLGTEVVSIVALHRSKSLAITEDSISLWLPHPEYLRVFCLPNDRQVLSTNGCEHAHTCMLIKSGHSVGKQCFVYVDMDVEEDNDPLPKKSTMWEQRRGSFSQPCWWEDK